MDPRYCAKTYEETEELIGHGWYNYLMLLTCCLITCACALDMFGFGVVVAAASCDLNLDFTKLGVVAAAPFTGVIFAFPWGYYADTRGRKRAMVLSTSIGCVFAIVSAFSTHWLFMLIVKIIASSFSQSSFSLAMTLLGETTGRKHRDEYLYIVSCINVASELVSFALARLILPLSIEFTLPLLQITFRSWRVYTIAIALPLVMGTALLYCLHESPKYLYSKGEYEKALDVLRDTYVKNGGKREDFPVNSIIPMDRMSSQGGSMWEHFKMQTVPIFKPPLLWRTIQLYFLMALCSSTNNVFFMWYPTLINYFFNSFEAKDSTEKTFCQRMFGKSNMTADTSTAQFQCNEELSPNTLYAGMSFNFFYLIVGMAILKVANRPRLLIILILLVSAVSQLLVNVKNPIANIIFFTLLQDTTMAFGSITSYFMNLYPTMNRALAASLSMMVGRLCALIGVSIMGSIITQHCEVTFYAWSVFVFGGVVVSFYLPPDRISKSVTIMQDGS